MQGQLPSSGREQADGVQTWEGGYGSKPGMIEAQGGTTYCAIASSSLLASSKDEGDTGLSTEERGETLRWCSQRQLGGFQGRPGKDEDACYSFWIGATISVSRHERYLLIYIDPR
jgi:geranylgeranyl transferase type-1 subunit beta